MYVKLVLLASHLLSLVSVVVVAGAKAKYSPNLAHNDGCIATTGLLTATLQDEMEMWVSRNGIDVIVTVEHSEGRCELRFNDPALGNKWLLAKLILKDNIELIINGTSMPSIRDCVRSLKRNTVKTVEVDNAEYLLSDCSEGPAIYQISQPLEDVIIPWYEEEAVLLLKPEEDTHIRIEVGGQEFVVCSDRGHIAAHQDDIACTAGVGTSGTTLIIPKSNEYIKVITSDGYEAVTQITNAAADVPPKVKKASITGTLIMQQCMAAGCNNVKHIPDDCSCTVYWIITVVFLVLSVVLAAALTYFVLRKQMCANAHKRSLARYGDDQSPEKTPMTNHTAVSNGQAMAA